VRVLWWSAMTVLSDRQIIEALKSGTLKINPFSVENLNPAGYDFCSSSEFVVNPKEWKLISTLETVELSSSLIATIHLKSSFVREGIVGSFAIIDPGFRGQLTLSIFNAGSNIIKINKNESIVQVVFHLMETKSAILYHGKYQDSSGITESKRR